MQKGCLVSVVVFVIIVIISAISSNDTSTTSAGSPSGSAAPTPELSPSELLIYALSSRSQGTPAAENTSLQQLLSRHRGTAEADSALKLNRVWAVEDSVERVRAERRGRQALAAMRKRTDEMTGVTVWEDKAAPRYVNSRSAVAMRIVGSGGNVYPRLIIYFVAEDWLFIEGYHIKADGRDFLFQPDSYGEEAVERDNDSGIWEWWNVPATGERMEVLEAIANAKTATIRYAGRQYRRDRTITAAERAAISRTLAAYHALRDNPTLR